ncbi:uncharacterized protein At2g39920 [Impatiens glandulifera]|uniref:uncharacterized protein At2g39920 n=1 Tax=Impatiens glandulifera TaxID=253017 RepID=UPI001FB148B4|nr:uncharacterized protein At2g39920 [Impatiens glandulifera]
MSAYGHQLDREFSSQSLSSRGPSETGSIGNSNSSSSSNSYVMEPGIYMSFLAATIFVGALATLGLLLVTLLVVLTVMLQSCDARSKGVIEIISNSSDVSNYCSVFSLHAELNDLDFHQYPVVCRVIAVDYVKGGQYAKDLNVTIELIENYLGNMKSVDDDGFVLMDIDSFLPSNSFHIYSMQEWFSDSLEKVKTHNRISILRLYEKLKAGRWQLVLLTRRHEKERNTTIEDLVSVGFGGWHSLSMRSEDESKMDNHEYFSRKKRLLLDEGFRVYATISSYMDTFAGLNLGGQKFKLPNPIFIEQPELIGKKVIDQTKATI